MTPLALIISTIAVATSLAATAQPAPTLTEPTTGRLAPTAPARTLEPAGPSSLTGRGVWPLPAPHPVRRGFEPPSSAWGAGHRGVDLGGSPGAPVRSSLAGTVTFASALAGRGVVVIDHGDYRTTYEPVTATVSVGDHVSRGGVIGHLSVTLSHCLPLACLHWGLLRGSAYLDPLMLVGGGPIRLLPMGGR